MEAARAEVVAPATMGAVQAVFFERPELLGKRWGAMGVGSDLRA